MKRDKQKRIQAGSAGSQLETPLFSSTGISSEETTSDSVAVIKGQNQQLIQQLQSVKQELQQLRELTNHITACWLVIASSRLILEASELAEALFELPADHLMGTSFDQFLLPDQQAKFKTLLQQTETEPGHKGAEFEINCRQTIKYIKIKVRNYDGRYYLTLFDFTQQKKLELDLVQSRLLLQANIENQKDINFFSIDSNFCYIYFNKTHQAAMKSGYNSDVQLGQKIFDFISVEEDRQKAYANLSKALHGTSHSTIEEFGELVTQSYESFFEPLCNEGDEIVGVTVLTRNISARIASERILLENRSLLAKIQNMAHLGSWDLDLIQNKVIWSEEVYRIFGIDAKEFEASYEAFLELVHPEDRELVSQVYFDSVHQNMDHYELEHRIVKKDTGEIRYLFERYDHVKDKNGKVIRSVGMVQDITERKRDETEILLKNEALKKINAEKDKYLSILAHDLRSPISGFMGLTQLMANGINKMTLAEIEDITSLMARSATNLYRLLSNSLEWTRLEQGQLTVRPIAIPLRAKVDESLVALLSGAKNKEIKVEMKIPESLTVWCDENMLNSMLTNLVANAIKYTPRTGKIKITAKNVPNQKIEITVADSGIGMSRELIDKLFRLNQQYSRLGTEGELSTGLGLILCKEFVEKNGGTLEVESKEGEGSIFRLTLPQSSTSPL